MKLGTKVAIFRESPVHPDGRIRFEGAGVVSKVFENVDYVRVQLGVDRTIVKLRDLLDLDNATPDWCSITFFTDASFVAEVSVTHPHQTNALIAFVKGRFHLVASATPESPSLGAYDSFPLALDAVLGVAADLQKVVA